MLQKYKKNANYITNLQKNLLFVLSKFHKPYFQSNKKKKPSNKNKINILFILQYISFVVTLHPVSKMLTKGCYRNCGC